MFGISAQPQVPPELRGSCSPAGAQHAVHDAQRDTPEEGLGACSDVEEGPYTPSQGAEGPGQAEEASLTSTQLNRSPVSLGSARQQPLRSVTGVIATSQDWMLDLSSQHAAAMQQLGSLPAGKSMRQPGQ